ncbi:MAG: hypothetical protein D3924_11935 [Candidatus Electrothrix sp. AR4]|nr:hypothetical protein [Candidatus Electrothrix sp. AR4]
MFFVSYGVLYMERLSALYPFIYTAILLMKFISKKGAPDIPLKVINARDNDELVLFCGSGISMPAGLKTFKGLVDQVYKSLAAKKDEDELEFEYYHACLYDRVLELLEYRYFKKDRANKYLIRQRIIENLIIEKDADLSTHTALLELAKTEDGRRRLVTTNVDRGFALAEPALERFIDAAPKLPFPKPYQWYSIVHLHGIIDDELDPDRKGENLVFTSGDFGTAYLTERWASKFVAELFRNFTVLFVGYSVNDPVVRYMTDAVAAERRKGDTHFHQPYILTAIQNDREKEQRAWRAKGIEPILYDSTERHTYLHQTLQNWAADCRDGLRAKKRIIQKSSRIIPEAPFEDDETREIIDTLREKSDQHDKALTGIPAKCFSELDPPPDISWLPALDKYGLFNQCTVPESCAPFSYSSEHEQYYNLVKPNIVTLSLWKWLAKHLAQKKLVHWVIDKGVSLHPELIHLIKEKITSKDKPDEPFLTFWRIIVSGNVLANSSERNLFNIVRQLKENSSPLDLQAFLSCLKPKVKFSKPLSFMPDEEEPVYEAEVAIEESSFTSIQEYNNADYTALLIPVLFDLSLLLKDAMELFQTIGLAISQEDKSCFDQPSIAPHDQNKRFKNWVILIQLCRDVWLSAWEKNRGIALATLDSTF